MKNREKLKNEVTIDKKDYLALLKIKKVLEGVFGSERKKEKMRGKGALERAFGVLKDSFGSESSLEYVKKLRKEWR